MKQLLAKNQRGIGHPGLMFAIIAILALAGVGYFIYVRNKGNDTSATNKTIPEALQNAKCDYNDRDLCRFFTSYKAQKYFTINSATEADGKKTVMVIKTEGADTSYIRANGEISYEIITIGDTTYTKAANGTWWKQTAKNDVTTDITSDAKIDLKEPGTTGATNKITYKKIGKEKCGNFSCFKYQEINPSDTKTTTFVWFDDKDYQLRRTLTHNNDTKSDATYSYSKVSITEPSPVKELGLNQSLIPGQSEPTTLPSTGDDMTEEELRQLMEQYQ